MNQGSMAPADWQTLQFAPLWVFTLAAHADGKRDKKETAAFAKEISEAHLYKCALTREVLLSIAHDFKNVWASYVADSRDVLIGLQQAAKVMSESCDADDADQFKRDILHISLDLVKASGGGRFSKKHAVTDEEKVAVAVIATALGVKMK